ncbi:MAG: T9SS type A sorting domain-containing protein [Candidatus Zixiibacteriota bacterium]|nr:MAG: T9SS type A sorting domain-containing protein [candidate division Zixibacteria bacterium]
MINKIIYIGLVLTILLVTFPAKAQIFSDDDTVDVVSILGGLGDTISVPINLINTFPVGGYIFRITYDTVAFEAISVDTTSRSSCFDYNLFNVDEPGVIRFLATTFNPENNTIPPGSGYISIVNLYLKDTAPGGYHDIRFENEDSTSYDNQLSNAAGDTLIIPVLVDGAVYVVQTGIDTDPAIPGKFELSQNYPNPFNAQTTIRFVLPKSQDIELTVYDLLGRRIEVLINEYWEAGVHTITFDASSLSSGVYFYRLQAGDAVETKRMVLLK